jgi:5-methylcytosine-specific restriction protein A
MPDMTPDAVWEAVHGFAETCLRNRQAVHTIEEGVRNYITDVRAGSIGRRSDEGRSNASRVTRRMVMNLWSELNGGDAGSGYLVFTKALVAGALPTLVEIVDGALRLRAAPRTYLLTWNPARFPFDERPDFLERCHRGERVPYVWSTGNTRSVNAGDRFFLLKQGQPPRGILASGTFVSAVFEREHFDEDKARQGRVALRADILFEQMVDPNTVLRVEHIATGPLADVYWATPASGIGIDAAAQELARLWEGHLRRRQWTIPDEVSSDATYVEGAVEVIRVNRYERDPAARAACLAHWGTRCLVCKFDFGAVYGDIGDGYIHVHHLQPLAAADGERQVDPVADLRPVCANCHAMLHQHDPPYSPEELQALIRRAREPRRAKDRGPVGTAPRLRHRR